MHFAAFARLIPPIASTGIRMAMHSSGKSGDSLGGAELALGRRIEDRAKESVAGAIRFRRRQLPPAMARDADQNCSGAFPFRTNGPRHRPALMRCPSCTPSEFAAIATSRRSFTITLVRPAMPARATRKAFSTSQKVHARANPFRGFESSRLRRQLPADSIEYRCDGILHAERTSIGYVANDWLFRGGRQREASVGGNFAPPEAR